MKNAAAAAKAPIAVTLRAPLIGGCPVTLLLKYPKTNKQRMVVIQEYIKPLVTFLVRK